MVSPRWPAPAKLNLFLRVIGRRPDGYHELQTLFQLLDWGDQIAIEITGTPAIRRTGDDYGVPEDGDLALRAARLLQSAAGVNKGAVIEVEKHIPMGAGLGGGSSDAATVLAALNYLWGCGLTLDELAALGLALGADVPVFVRGHTALAEGVGERLQPVSLGPRSYVLVLPGTHIPTREVFSDPDLPRNSPAIDLDAALAGKGGNDCEAVVRRRYPEMDRAFRALARWGEPRMTGTGSGIFLAMPDHGSAISAASEIKSLYNVRAVDGMDRSLLHRRLEGGG
ncbi:MAG: 4-(cytidine 5'-diphospho)-2-C-methyl-D-erythritol kinase [Lysobacterales bacterium]|jgi:4-diphosphocytidyl-2-C-methyl-D-erythritol kinase